MIAYPRKILKGVVSYLKRAERDLLRRQKNIKKEDPFNDSAGFRGNMSEDTEAVEQFAHARSQALSQETEDALERVRRAMQRIDEGSYGFCLSCGSMIDTDRLGIDPTAEFCITCAKKKK